MSVTNPGAPTMIGEESEKEWEARHDLETLIEAEKIKRDEKRLKAAMKKKRELAKSLEDIDGKKGN